MLEYHVTGAREVIERLGAAPQRVREAATGSLDAWATELAGYIKADKLSGQVLNRRSGLLSGSVHPLTDDTERGIVGGAGAGAGVPYARIHEFGGLIPAHEVVAKNAKALSIPLGASASLDAASLGLDPSGLTMYVKRVQIPAIQMPERSYMRSSFDEKSPQGLEELRAAVKEALVS